MNQSLPYLWVLLSKLRLTRKFVAKHKVTLCKLQGGGEPT